MLPEIYIIEYYAPGIYIIEYYAPEIYIIEYYSPEIYIIEYYAPEIYIIEYYAPEILLWQDLEFDCQKDTCFGSNYKKDANVQCGSKNRTHMFNVDLRIGRICSVLI